MQLRDDPHASTRRGGVDLSSDAPEPLSDDEGEASRDNDPPGGYPEAVHKQAAHVATRLTRLSADSSEASMKKTTDEIKKVTRGMDLDPEDKVQVSRTHLCCHALVNDLDH